MNLSSSNQTAGSGKLPGQKSDVIRIIPAGAPTELGENHFINCFPESIDNSLTQVKRAFCVKRKGLKNTLVSKSGASGEARGVYYWADTDYTFMVYGSTVYAFSSASSTVEQYTVSLATSAGPVGFTETSYGETRKLFFCDGQDGYLIDKTTPTSVITMDNSNVVDYTISAAGSGYSSAPTVSFSGGGGSGVAATATISAGAVIGLTFTNFGSGYTSAPTVSFSGGGGSGAAAVVYLSAFPVPHQPTPIAMDGFIFLSKSNTTSVYNCDVGNYQVWKTATFLQANQFPGNVVALARQQNYVFAMKGDAVEYLYNAANVSPLSTLSKTTQATTAHGVAQVGSVTSVEDATLFVGKSSAGGFGVYKIENFKEEKLSTEYIDYVLNEVLGLYSTTPKDQYYLSGSVIRVDGHRFYVLNEVTDTANSRALVYDLDEKFWSFWDSSAVAGTRRYIGIRSHNKQGVSIVQIPVTGGSGKVLYHSTTSTSGDYNDNGVVYYSYYNTPVIDMDNRYRKRFNRVEVVGNKYSYSCPVTIMYSDSNVEAIDKLSNTTWTVDMQIGVQSYLTNLGFSRSRIWQIGQATDVPFRFENIEIFYMQGEH